MSDQAFKWDFFIAHAGDDAEAAEELYEHLHVEARTFVDTKCLVLGDDWDRRLPAAQSRSLITIVLVSSKTQQAYYQREEIAAAIGLAREDAHAHRVIPVYLDEAAEEKNELPYGLRSKHGMRLAGGLTLEDAAKQLLATLEHLKSSGADSSIRFVPQVPPPAGAVTTTNTTSTDSPPPTLPRRRRRSKVWILLATLAVVGTVGIIAWKAWPRHNGLRGVLVEVASKYAGLPNVEIQLEGTSLSGAVETLGTWPPPGGSTATGGNRGSTLTDENYYVLFKSSELSNADVSSLLHEAFGSSQPIVLGTPNLGRLISSETHLNLTASLFRLDGAERVFKDKGDTLVSTSSLLRIAIK